LLCHAQEKILLYSLLSTAFIAAMTALRLGAFLTLAIAANMAS
jgi:hypothetical protein